MRLTAVKPAWAAISTNAGGSASTSVKWQSASGFMPTSLLGQ